MEKVIAVFFYLFFGLQILTVDLTIGESILNNDGWEWLFLPVQLAFLAMMALFTIFYFLWAPTEMGLLKKGQSGPEPMGQASVPRIVPLPPPQVTPSVPMLSGPTLPIPKPIQLSLGVSAGPQQELFAGSPDVPKASPVYPAVRPEVHILDGEKPSYGIADVKPGYLGGDPVVQKALKLFPQGIIEVRRKDGPVLWPLDEDKWERDMAAKLRGLKCPTCGGSDLGAILWGQLPVGDGRTNHLMRLKLLIPGGCFMGAEDVACNDCDTYWVSGKGLSEFGRGGYRRNTGEGGKP